MQSFLIIGADEKGRIEEAERIVGKDIASLGNNPDFFLLQIGEGNSISIEETRKLQSFLILKPFQEKEKICLIEEAQNLTVEAQNCLLKTLEEPPPDCRIIMTALDASFLLPTVVSRCQIVRLPAKQALEISEKEFTEISEMLDSILNSSLGKRLKIIEGQGIAKDRASAVQWLDKLTVVVRQLALSSRQTTYLNTLHLITKYKKYIDSNCNLRLTLDNFLLDLPSKNS